jgi:hypothetical protein
MLNTNMRASLHAIEIHEMQTLHEVSYRCVCCPSVMARCRITPNLVAGRAHSQIYGAKEFGVIDKPTTILEKDVGYDTKRHMLLRRL